jgi:WD40 repeat protein
MIKMKISTFIIYLMLLFCHQTTAQKTVTKEILWTTDWSPNGKYIAIGGNVDSLKIYSGIDLKTYQSIPIKNTITRVKWHPTKNIIAVATQNSKDKTSIINLDNNETIELTGISPEGARGIDWNNTGELLAVADNDGHIFIYTDKGVLIRKFLNQPNSTKSITAIDWHPQKNMLTTVTDKIRFFDAAGNLLQAIQHRPEAVLLLSIAWHPSGDFFVTGDYGDEANKSLLQYWNEQGELIKSIDLSKGEYRNLVWNKTGNRLASASDALRIWDTSGNLIAEGNSKDYLWGVSWNAQGNKIVTSSVVQRIIIWNNQAKKITTIE